MGRGGARYRTAEKPARSRYESALMGMEGGVRVIEVSALGAIWRVFRPGQKG
jgi:hypothetical protein